MLCRGMHEKEINMTCYRQGNTRTEHAFVGWLMLQGVGDRDLGGKGSGFNSL